MAVEDCYSRRGALTVEGNITLEGGGLLLYRGAYDKGLLLYRGGCYCRGVIRQ